jgi:hypothetical protein
MTKRQRLLRIGLWLAAALVVLWLIANGPQL